MSANYEPPPGEESPLPDEEGEDVVGTVAKVSEPILTAASAGLSIFAVVRAAIGDIPVVGPVAAVAVTALLPIVSAAIERRREERSERANRARAHADAAWDAIVAAREG